MMLNNVVVRMDERRKLGKLKVVLKTFVNSVILEKHSRNYIM
jgi:hypothetical protein